MQDYAAQERYDTVVIGGGLAILMAPLALQQFPDRFVDGRAALLSFAGASAALALLLVWLSTTSNVSCNEGPDQNHGLGSWEEEGSMIAVIFEVWPKPDRKKEYLDIAAELRPLLEKIDGFMSIERFESLYEPGKILSLSFFRDEAAVLAWRNTSEHRVAQAKGRGGIFSDYRLRVAGVIRDYGMNQRGQVPSDSRAVHRA